MLHPDTISIPTAFALRGIRRIRRQRAAFAAIEDAVMRALLLSGLFAPSTPLTSAQSCAPPSVTFRIAGRSAGLPHRYPCRRRTPWKAWQHLPVLRGDDLRDLIPYGAVPVAVDLVEGRQPT